MDNPDMNVKNDKRELDKILSASERWKRLYETVLSNTPDFAYVFDLNHRFIYVNKALLKMWGRTWEEAIGKTCLELGYEPWHAAMHDREIDAVISTKSPVRGDVPFSGTFGERIYDYIFVPILDDVGNVEGIAGTTRDVTDRKRIEREKHESEQRFRLLFDSMDEGYCVIEVIFDAQKRPMNYRFLDTNSAFEKQTGLKDAKGKLMRDLVPSHEQHWFDIYGEIALTGETRRFENRAAALDRWYEICAFRIGPAELCQLGVIFNDITERKNIAEERQAMLEAERAARSEAERAGRMKDEFLATLSHELRTPLNAILGYATILRMKKLNEAQAKEIAETIERNARVQAQLIQDLLDMNGIISGKVRLDMKKINFGEVIEEAIKTVKPSAQAKSIGLEVLMNAPVIPVQGDPNRMQQVIWNLLSNAIKFTPRGGRVQIWLTHFDSYVELKVMDDGAGIEPDFLPYVFDRFSQADGSITRPHGGLGLGLAIVKQLVELHGGNIQVSSAGENQGATFTITLPVLSIIDLEKNKELAPSRLLDQKRVSHLDKETWHIDLSDVRVLVVDDEPDATRLVKMVLQNCRAHVAEATSVREAFALLSRSKFDVLISDIGMPGEDGYQLIRKVRTMPDLNRNIPAIALTAFARSEDRRRAALAGFQKHLNKPIEAPELIASVANLSGKVNQIAVVES